MSEKATEAPSVWSRATRKTDGRTVHTGRNSSNAASSASIAYPARLWVPTRRPDGHPLDVEAVALDLIDYGVPVDLIDAGGRVEIMREIAQQTD